MSGNADLNDISAYVDAIIAKYNDAAAIIQKVKANRADKQAPAPSRYLEETIQCAPAEMMKEKERGIRRVGLAFQRGDDTALNALREVNDTLQMRLLQELQNLVHREELADFKQLVDAVDCGRDQTIDALVRLRQRCLSAEATENEHRRSSDASISPKDLPLPRPEPAKTYSFPQHNPWLRMHGRSHTMGKLDASGEEDTQSGAETPHRKHGHHGASFFQFLKHHRPHSHGDKTPEQSAGDDSRDSIRVVTTSQREALSQQQNRSVVSLGESQDQGPWWANNDSVPLQRQTSQSSHRDSQASVDTVVAISPKTVRSRAASSATSLFQTQSLAVPTPSQENDYLGFCKAAVRMQNGDKKAMEKRKEFNDGWSQATVYYLSCSTRNCVFSGHIDVNVVMTKVFAIESKGMRFRWAFLAKSHVMQQKTKDNNYSFRCLFCVFSGEQTAVYHGNDAYLDHVSTHRGDIGAITLYKTRCINDHVASNSEEFDINLFPLSTDEARFRRGSDMLTDDLAALNMSPYGMGKNDSVLQADKPWNEGLSDFHYRDEFERGEIG